MFSLESLSLRQKPPPDPRPWFVRPLRLPLRDLLAEESSPLLQPIWASAMSDTSNKMVTTIINPCLSCMVRQLLFQFVMVGMISFSVDLLRSV